MLTPHLHEKQNLSPAAFLLCHFFLIGLVGCIFHTESGEDIPGYLPPYEITMEVYGLYAPGAGMAPEEYDQIGMYGIEWEHGSELPLFLPEACTIENVKFLFQHSESGWFPERPLYYPEKGKKLDMYGYYPYHPSLLADGSSVFSFQVAQDQSSYDRYAVSDFCAAHETGVYNSAEKLPVRFSHMLSQVVFMVKATDEYPLEILLDAEIVIRNAILNYSYDLSMGRHEELVPGDI